MAKVKVKTNFDYNKLARKIPEIIEDNLNILGAHINRAIQDGIDNGTDITGKPFAKLSTDSTTKLRSGSSPLLSEGVLRKTKLTKATSSNPVFTIKMNGKSKKTLPMLNGKKVKRKNTSFYGAFHNQKGGYRTSPKSAIPNKDVPQRKWFGIPDSALPGGTEYEKASVSRKLKIRKALKTVMK